MKFHSISFWSLKTPRQGKSPDFQWFSPFKFWELPTVFLNDEIKTVLWGKFGFENWEQLIIIALYGWFRLIGFKCNDHTWDIFVLNSVLEIETVDWSAVWRSKTGSLGEERARKSTNCLYYRSPCRSFRISMQKTNLKLSKLFPYLEVELHRLTRFSGEFCRWMILTIILFSDFEDSKTLGKNMSQPTCLNGFQDPGTIRLQLLDDFIQCFRTFFSQQFLYN